LVENKENKFEVSVKKVESIIITTSAAISTDAIKFAMENNIDIIFLDQFGNPYGRVWHSKLGSTTLIVEEPNPLKQGLKQKHHILIFNLGKKLCFNRSLKKV